MSQAFHIIHTQPNLKHLLPWAQRQGLVPNRGQGDLGYAFHAALKAAFADLAPQPFCYKSGGGLLAYTSQAEAMQSAASMATPEVANMLGLDANEQTPGMLFRPFPTSWKEGKLLAFEVRVRPVARKENKEQDVFLSTAQRMPDIKLSRENVYAEWLTQQFDTVAELSRVAMTEFSLSTVIRRGVSQIEGTRSKRAVQGPDAVLSGVLQVNNGSEFAALVTRGIGRHRAFGFGMILLKPIDVTRV